jgi:hypothetical protein
MRIAFDLDDTLIPGMCVFPVEPLPANPLRRWCCAEPVRLGTGWLFRELRAGGHDVWIYTTSFRSPASVKRTFWGYSAPVRRVINQAIHQRRVEALGHAYRTCTKYPPAFGIDLLVDECLGVAEESRRWNFAMLRVDGDDADWTQTVLAAVR